MFAVDVIESFVMIGVITLAFVYYGVVLGKGEGTTRGTKGT
jgi:hypothetical protein